MIHTDSAAPGLKVVIHDAQPNRRDGPVCPGRKGELVRPINGSKINWYVWVYAQGRRKERLEAFDLAELSIDRGINADGKQRRFLTVGDTFQGQT